MWIRCVAAIAFICPVLSQACDSSDRRQCKEELSQLVVYRTQAIEYAFGNVFGPLPREVEIRFVRAGDEQYERFSGRVAYDSKDQVLVVPKRYIGVQMPMPLRWAASYWPYYRNRQYQDMFPVIAAIDSALWGAVLQETARRRGMSWPHAECGSIDLAKRLPCEMLIAGVGALLTETHAAIFNTNAIERIWPEQFSAFQQRSWRSEREYVEVQRYGGILLLRPLFSEFGVPNALAYVARTPFLVEDDNMRVSALRYQARAREVLQSQPALLVTEGETDQAEQITLPQGRARSVIAFGTPDGA